MRYFKKISEVFNYIIKQLILSKKYDGHTCFIHEKHCLFSIRDCDGDGYFLCYHCGRHKTELTEGDVK